MEIWKPIEGYEGLYEISNYGNVKNVRTGKLLKPFAKRDGYLQVGLWKNGVGKKFLVHMLVAEHFISKKPFENAQVNHKDLNRCNNHVDNLEWVSPRDNVLHAIKNNPGRAERLKQYMSKIGKIYGHENGKKNAKRVAQIDPVTEAVIKVYESCHEAERQTNGEFKYRGISMCALGKRKTYKGYKWAYI